MFVEERGALFVELAAGAEEGEAGREGGVGVNFIAELTGKGEEGEGHFRRWWHSSRVFVHPSGFHKRILERLKGYLLESAAGLYYVL